MAARPALSKRRCGRLHGPSFFAGPAVCFKPRGFLVRPMNQLLALAGGEPCVGVNQSILNRRHFVISQLFADVLQPSRRAVWITNRPVGKIQMPAAFLHITCHQPRHRRYAAIPRPFRLVGMTIVTRRAEHPGDFNRRHGRGQKIVNDRRVRARRIRELQQSERHNNRAQNPFQYFFHSIGTEASREPWPCGQALNHQAAKSVSHPRQ